MATTSSYDYWWPYPAWGATTAAITLATALPPTSTSTSTVSSFLAATLAPPLVTVSATDSLLSTAVRPVAPMTTSASPTSSVSIIRITALPPSNGTSSQKSSVHATSGFDIAYLAPLFAVLAAVLGALCTWFLLRWRARRRDAQAHGSSILHTGPRYAPPPVYSEASVPQGSSSSSDSGGGNEASNLLYGRTDSTKGGWVARAFSRSSRQSQAVPTVAPITPVTSVERQGSVRVQNMLMNNPYSAVENEGDVDDSRAMLLDSRGSEHPGMHLAVRVASPDMLSPGSDDVPYDTLRHKSIRRAIIERLKFGTLRRPAKGKTEGAPDVESGRTHNSPVRRVSSRRGHKRNDSDFNIEDLQRQHDGPSRKPSRVNSVMREVPGRSLMMSPPGFRIIEEDTEADSGSAENRCLMGASRLEEGPDGSTPTRENPAWKWIASWSPSPTIHTEDSYTALPVRRTTAKRSGSVSYTPILPRTDEYPSVAPTLARVDSSILPSSPPQVMSPPLHSKLFFSDFGSTPSLDLHMPKEQTKPAAWKAHTPERHVARLHTKREPDPLPFPSTSESSPYRGRLKKPHHALPTSPPVPSSPEMVALHTQYAHAFPSSPADQEVYAEKLLARQSALDKVGDIVSRGLSQRDLANVPGGDERRVKTESLPGFAVDRVTRMEARDGVLAGHTMVGHGIEQRLELLAAEESVAMENR